MCLIAIAPKGISKDSDFFWNAIRIAATKHRDGFGYAFKKSSTRAVFTAKGYMVIEKMIQDIKDHKLKDDDELVIHLRMKSAGAINKENTHPFEIPYTGSGNVSYTIHGRTTLLPVMFHNGTLINFIETSSTNTMSDTYHFANKFMKSKQIWEFLKADKDKFVKAFKNVIGYNKFVFLSHECDPIIIGEFETENGYIFSNVSYKSTMRPFDYSSNTNNNSTNNLILSDKNIPNSLNTNIIKVNESNFHHFYIKSKCRSVVGSKIEEGEYFFIKQFNSLTKNVLLEEKYVPGSFRFIDINTLNTVFIICPKAEYARRYMDYIKMHSRIQATKSSIKKIFAKVVSISNRKNDIPKSIDIKYKNQKMGFDYNAIIMFLNDYKQYINDYKLTELLKAIEPEVSNEPEPIGQTCEC